MAYCDFLNRPDFKRFKAQKIYATLQEQVRTIAVYKGGGGLGDLVVAIVLFGALKKMFPRAQVRYMGIIYPRFKKIFANLPYVDGYIHYERPNKGKRMPEYYAFRKEWQGKIDLLVDTQRRWETSFWLRRLKPRYMLSASMLLSDWGMPRLNYKTMHIVEQMLSLPARLGMQEFADIDTALRVPEECTAAAAALLAQAPQAPLVALMPSCGMEFKNWLPEYFARVGDLFAKQGFTIIILGSPRDAMLFNVIAGQMQHKPLIPALTDVKFSEELLNDAALLKRCAVAVGNDSGGMHLASCLGILNITIFGPTTPRKFAPIGPKTHVMYEALPCSPCRFVCKRPVARECLVKITPEAVFAKAMEELKKDV